MFLTAQSDQIIKTLTLIGDINNTEFKNFLRKSSISLNGDYLKYNYLPTVKEGKSFIKPIFANEDQLDAGYEIITTVYVFG